MKKRFYIFMFSALAFVGQAWAAMPDGEEEEDIIIPVAIVNGETPYATLDGAFYSSTDSTVTNIQLVDDAKMGLIVLQKGVTVSLDLNGHKVEIESQGIYNYGTLTITDSSNGRGSMILDHGNVSMIYNYGELTITGGTFTCSSQEVNANDVRRCLITFAGSTTHIMGGTFTSTGQVILLAGETVIDTGTFSTTGNCDVVANYCTDKQLVINNGLFSNLADIPSGNDVRRCLWTNTGTSTLIKGGTFTSGKHVLYLLGSAIVNGGNFTTTGNGFVVGNLAANGDVVINGGTFTNLGSKPAEGTDQRYCVISYQNTRTAITAGKFTSPYQVLVFNGDATVSGGEFVTTGNINVVHNYNTTGELVIKGGTFLNNCELPEDSPETDNRRCLWANVNTNTIISGGTFTNNSTAQTITIYHGKATVSGGTITNNGHGSGIATNGNVEITGCRIKAWNMLICWTDGKMVCSGGLYSEPIPSSLLAEGCECIDNTDPGTMETYPYKVVKGTPGDVNGDGSVDVADIASVISVMAGDGNYDAADVNGDGSVDVADIASIISIMAGEN